MEELVFLRQEIVVRCPLLLRIVDILIFELPIVVGVGEDVVPQAPLVFRDDIWEE
jgi:hypothetical protein